MPTLSTTPSTAGQPPEGLQLSGDASRTRSNKEAEPSSRRWIFNSGRNQTNLVGVEVDTRAKSNANIFRRPQALLHKLIEDEKDSLLVSTTTSNSSGQRDAKDSEERSAGNIPKQLKRLDLFVDVLWVGIIANLSGTFGEQAFTDSGVETGSAVIE